MAAIDIRGVTKVYGSDVVAVDNVTLEIEDGEFMVLVGPSGCGKSTLLRMIAGLEEVSAGEIAIGDRTVTDLAPRHRDVAMVFQSYALYPHMSVRQNLGYGLKVRKTPKPEIDRRVTEVAELLGLTDLLDRRPGQLSGGQRQRVAMGRAIVREPQGFLMDEPLSNLDAKLRVGMRASLKRLHARLGVTTIYVTHDQTEAMTLGRRVAVMRDGRIVQVDTPQNLYREPCNAFVAAFIGSPAMNLVEATLTDAGLSFGQFVLPLAPAHRPDTSAERVILGIRPELFEDARRHPEHPQLEVEVVVLEELGAERHVFFTVDAPRALSDEGNEAEDETDLIGDASTLFVARIEPDDAVRAGERITLAIDPARIHFFDAESGEALSGRPVSAPGTEAVHAEV